MSYNKELGANIRADLKAAGIPARAVSVRVKDAGYETAVRVTVKDISVDKAVVEKIAMRHRDVSYDERSYEILAGGNTFVFVDYDYDVLKNATEQYLEQAQAVIDSVKERAVGVDAATRPDGSRLVYFHHDTNSAYNTAEIFDKDGKHDYENRHSAYNAYALAQAMALFNAIGHF